MTYPNCLPCGVLFLQLCLLSPPGLVAQAIQAADPGTEYLQSDSNKYDANSSAIPESAYPIQGTFLNFYRNLTPELWSPEFQYMKDIDINTIVVVSVGHLRTDSTDPLGFSLAPDGLLYPSNYIGPLERPTSDRLEMILSLADQQGMKVLLGSLQTATDWTDGTGFNALRAYNQRVAAEILQRYGRHQSLQGWYFTQEVWMNWVKYYGSIGNAAAYYGTTLMANWASDLKQIDPTKRTAASVVIKKTGSGSMPGLTAAELQQWTTSFLQTAAIDILMPQDGIGAQSGAPSIGDLPSYYSALAAAVQAAGTNTTLWDTLETFTAVSGATGDQYPPAAISRIQQQVSAVRPYVTGYISWIFGDDMSPQATCFPVEASQLNRRYQYVFKPQTAPNDDILPLQSYQYSSPPDSRYADSAAVSKLSDRTGGGHSGCSLDSWVGFSNNSSAYTTTQITGDLGSVKSIKAVRALVQSRTPSAIYHPYQIDVAISQNGWNWTAFGSTNAFAPDTPGFTVMWGEVTGSAAARYVRWTFTYKQWLFLAELEVVGPR